MATVNFKNLQRLCEIIEALEKVGAQIDYTGKIDYEHNYEIMNPVYDHLLLCYENPEMDLVRKVFKDLCKKSKQSYNRWDVFTDLYHYMLQNVHKLDEDSATYILQTMYKKGYSTEYDKSDKYNLVELYKLTRLNRLLDNHVLTILKGFYKDAEFMNVVRERFDRKFFCTLVDDPKIIEVYDAVKKMNKYIYMQ